MPATSTPSVEERARRVIALIDLTDLADDHSPAGIESLCERAATHGTAAVCVWPEFVDRCAATLADSGVQVATVVNFPSGDEGVDDVVRSTERALDHGADDIDLVLPHRAFLAGRIDDASAMVETVAAAVGQFALLKVILETGALPHDRIADATRLAIDGGADFVKTSTGKIEVGATPGAVEEMLAVIAAADRPIGLKPSGGVRRLADAESYLDRAEAVMGAGWPTPATFRFGASSLLDDLLADITAAG